MKKILFVLWRGLNKLNRNGGPTDNEDAEQRFRDSF